MCALLTLIWFLSYNVYANFAFTFSFKIMNTILQIS